MFKWMKKNLKWIMIATIAVFVITCSVMYGISRGSDRSDVVAKVNGEKISRKLVDSVAAGIAEQQSRSMPGVQGTSEDNIYLFRVRALEYIGIEAELKKEFDKSGIDVSRKEINEHLDKIIAQYKSKEDFEEAIRRNGMTKAEVKEKIKYQLAQQKYVQKLTDAAKITDDQVKKFYEDGKTSIFLQPAGYNVLIGLFGSKAAADIAKKAIDSGTKWDNIMKEQKALKYSEESKPEKIAESQCSGMPFSVIKTLADGQTSDVLQIPDQEQYMIFLKKGSFPQKQLTFDEVKKDIVKTLKDQEAGWKYTRFIRKLKKNLNIELVDEEYFNPQQPAAPAADKTQQSAPAGQTAPAK